MFTFHICEGSIHAVFAWFGLMYGAIQTSTFQGRPSSFQQGNAKPHSACVISLIAAYWPFTKIKHLARNTKEAWLAE